MINVDLFLTGLSIIIITTILIALNHHFHRQNKQKAYQAGVQWLALFKEILVLIQQHRGLTTGYLNGNTEISSRINQLQFAIKQQQSAINNYDDWLVGNEYWLGIQDHWDRLSVNYKNAKAVINYDQHNRLIGNLLFLIEECAENHNLQELTIYKTHSANFLWQDLLYAAEYIGQARALGTGIAAAKKSTSVQRIKLNYLLARINDLIKQHKLTELNTDIDTFTKTIESEVLSQIPSIASEAYFNLATKNLNKVMAKFDEYLSQLSLNIKG